MFVLRIMQLLLLVCGLFIIGWLIPLEFIGLIVYIFTDINKFYELFKVSVIIGIAHGALSLSYAIYKLIKSQ